MDPKWHVLWGFTFAVLVYLFSPIGLISSFIIFVSSVLIDLDKFIIFIFSKRSLDFLTFYKEGIKGKENWKSLKEKKKLKHELRFFHSIEVLLILGGLTFFQSWFLFIILGFISHLILDIIDYTLYNADPLNKLSIFYTLITNKKKSLENSFKDQNFE